jgi:hypothetical protein
MEQNTWLLLFGNELPDGIRLRAWYLFFIFMDAGACGWIKRGCLKEIKSNSGRQRININGAVNVENLCSVVRMDERINAQSTVLLLKQIQAKHGEANKIIQQIIRLFNDLLGLFCENIIATASNTVRVCRASSVALVALMVRIFVLSSFCIDTYFIHKCVCC